MNSNEILEVMSVQAYKSAITGLSREEQLTLIKWVQTVAAGEPIPNLEITPAIAKVLSASMAVSASATLRLLGTLKDKIQESKTVFADFTAAAGTRRS